MSHSAYIAFGSNLAEPELQVRSALQSLTMLAIDSSHISCSSLYASKALGPGKQPEYINGVCSIETTLDAYQLLEALQTIELDQGRERSVKNAARTLDLDILLFDDIVNNDPLLTIPHPRMFERNFVIFPLLEIAPKLILPTGQSILFFAQQLNWQDLKKLNIVL